MTKFLVKKAKVRLVQEPGKKPSILLLTEYHRPRGERVHKDEFRLTPGRAKRLQQQLAKL